MKYAMVIRHMALVTACALALGACSKKDDVTLTNASVEDVARAAAKAKPMKPGNWTIEAEITDVQLKGAAAEHPQAKAMVEAMKKSMIGKKQVSSHCVTKEQAEKPGENFFVPKDMADKCKYDSFTMADGKLAAELNCTPPGAPAGAHVSMNGTYDETNYVVDTKVSSDAGDKGGMDMSIHTSSKFTGECTGGK